MAGTWQKVQLTTKLYLLIISAFSFLQVKSGTIFDNFLVTDDEEYAKQMASDTWGVTKDAEKKMKDKVGGR